MEIAYGIDITNKGAQFLRAAAEALALINEALVPGAFMVDTVPIRASH